MISDDPISHFPHLTLQTLIGISVAVAGNILISLALNLQKLAHQRLDCQRCRPESKQVRGRDSGTLRPNGPSTHGPGAASGSSGNRRIVQERMPVETQPLMPTRSSSVPPISTYGPRFGDTVGAGDDSWSRKSTNTGRMRRLRRKQSFVPRLLPLHLNFGISSRDPFQDTSPGLNSASIPVDFISNSPRNSDRHKSSTSCGNEDENESDYLRSKLWSASGLDKAAASSVLTQTCRWLGFVLMNVGETGNFISYGFAPASVVAPLGTVSRWLELELEGDLKGD